MGKPVSVVVASEHGATRTGMRQALQQEGLEVCAEALDADDAIDAVERSDAGCCLLEVQLPGDALLAASEIKKRRPKTAVVMLADEPSPSELLSCVRAGAAGYLPKSVSLEGLAAALTDASLGAAAIPRRLMTSVLEAVRTGSAGVPLGLPSDVESRLSRREMDVLKLLPTGATTSTIAARLSISPVTVRRHVSSIVEKLGVDDREAAVELLTTTSAASSGEF